MTTLLQRLIEYAWILYTGCAIGVVVYVVRALVAHKEQGLAIFTLEREMATARAVQAWGMVVIFIAIGAVIFISATFILPDLPFYNPAMPLPTSTPRAGVELFTPGATPTPTEPLIQTLTPLTTTGAISTPPPPEPTEPPQPEPTEAPTPTATPEAAASGEVSVRFGDFAALISYSLPATQVTTSEPLLLTLYWRALEGTSPTNYMVFTHLRSEDGDLIAQHDGAPAGGNRPTTRWVAGETIVDSHPMIFNPEFLGYTGPATIAVGLYDFGPGRVPTETGDDYFILPVTINIVSQ